MRNFRHMVNWVAGFLFVLIALPAPAQSAGDRAYVVNGSADAVSIVDVGSGSLAGTIAVGARPFDVAVSPDGARAYVAAIDGHTVSVIDTATDAVVATVPVAMHPTSIAVSPDGSRVYVVCGGWLLVAIDAATNTVARQTSGYLGYLVDVAVSRDGSRLYLTENFSNHYGPMLGNLATADAATGDVLARTAVYDPGGTVLSADGARAYVVNQRGGFSVVDVASGSDPATVPQGYTLFGGLALSPAGDRIYVSDRVAGTVSVLDGTSYAVLASIAVGSEPTHVAMSPDGARVVVSNAAAGTASIVDAAANAVVATVSVGGRPGALAFVPAAARPAVKEQCKHGGWRAYPQFRNEGLCVRSVVRPA